MYQIRTNIINPVDPETIQYLPDHVVSINNGEFSSVEPYDEKKHRHCHDYTDYLCLPGLIDLHVHLSQFYIMGKYRPALLPWLSEVVFEAEKRSSDSKYASSIAENFLIDLISKGTTTAVIYTAPYENACELAFQEAKKYGIRALIGMTLMDQNAPQNLIQDRNYAIEKSISLYEKWHQKSPLMDYIFTPRFAPTCSEVLMQEIGRFASAKKAFIQTHLSENKDEIEWVKEIFKLPSYTSVYEKYGLLTDKTLLAHCIHLGDEELNRIKAHGSKIVHCPDSNFYLKSGEFPLQRVKDHSISFGLGSDVGAGTTLNMFHHAKMFNYRQSRDPVSPCEAFYAMTLGAAKVLDWEGMIGSIQSGKRADFILVERKESAQDDYEPRAIQAAEAVLSQMIFCPDDFDVIKTFVDGTCIGDYSIDEIPF